LSSRRSRWTVLSLLVAMAVAVTVGLNVVTSHHGASGPTCQTTAGSSSYTLDLEQAANATTVAAVGKRLGLPDHAVTVALAAALQESRLRNLSYGDLDSRGLFQQRPSQGWGTSSQIMVPSYAAGAFYEHLALVPGWQDKAVTDAAQSVQRSAAPSAYAQWESEARVLAQALTGEVPAGLVCRFRNGAGTPLSSELSAAMTTELGSGAMGVSLPPARGWTVAAWLVGHASRYRIPSVVFAGQRWTAARGTWEPDSLAGPDVQITSGA